MTKTEPQSIKHRRRNVVHVELSNEQRAIAIVLGITPEELVQNSLATALEERIKKMRETTTTAANKV